MRHTVSLRAFSTLTATLCLAACQNYTLRPVCNPANSAPLTGVSGDYTLSTQNEAFAVTTETFHIGTNAATNTFTIATDGRAPVENATCSIGGHLISESYDETVRGYTQDRVYVTGLGLTFLPLFFDRASLEASGIPTKIIEVPAGSSRRGAQLKAKTAALWTRLLALADTSPGLLIDNSDTDANTVMAHAVAAPAGLNYIRQ